MARRSLRRTELTAMEALARSLPLLLNVALAALVFALGLNARASDVTFLWRQPGLLLRSLIAMVVAVPVAAVLLLLASGLDQPVAIGILAMAVSPGAPLAPQKAIKLSGRLSYVYSLLVTVTLLAMVTIPLTLSILHRLFTAEVESLVVPRDVARIALIKLLLPLGLGIAVRRWLPTLADRVADPIASATNVFIGLVALLIIVKALPAMMGLGPKALGTMALLTLAALASGHLLGGPISADRSALAVTSSLRHPGLAMMIAKVELPDQKITAVILAYIVIGAIAAIPYTAWRKRAARPQGGTAHVETS